MTIPDAASDHTRWLSDKPEVRLGSLADIATALQNVRFTPESGHHRNQDAGMAKIA
jgi:hypothetical protein